MDSHASASGPESRDPRSEARSPRLLLTEDNPADARLVKELLSESRSSRWDITWTRSKEAALERLNEGPAPDAVLLDLELPDSRGLGTLRDVLAVTPWLPVVVLTGHADSRLGAEAVRAGAQDYLLKDEVTAGELMLGAV